MTEIIEMVADLLRQGLIIEQTEGGAVRIRLENKPEAVEGNDDQVVRSW